MSLIQKILSKEEFSEICDTLTDKLTSYNIRVDIDDRNESIGKRIRDAEKDWIRYTLVIGEKEANVQAFNSILIEKEIKADHWTLFNQIFCCINSIGLRAFIFKAY